MSAPATYQRPLYRVLLLDSSGAGVTGIANSDANLRVAYISDAQATPTVCSGSTIEAVTTVGTYQAPSASDRVRFREVNSANLPGLYEVHLPTASHGAHPVQLRVWDVTTTARWVNAWTSVPVQTPANTVALGGSVGTIAQLEASLLDYETNGGFKATHTDATTIPAAVRTNLTTELGRLDAAVSSRSTLDAAGVWAHTTRTLSSFGTLVSDIWSHTTRTLTAISDSAGVTTLLSRIVGILASGTHSPQSGDSFARLGANGAGLTALGDARLANLDAAVSTRLATAGYTAPPTVGAIADGVWDEGLAGHLTAGSAGAALNDASGIDGTDLASAVLDALSSDYDTPGTIGASIVSGGTGGGLTAQETADAVWQAVATDYDDSTTQGYKLRYTSTATAAQIADAVWAEPIATQTTTGSTGAALATAGTGGIPPEVLTQLDVIEAALATLRAADLRVANVVANARIRLSRGYDYRAVAGTAVELRGTGWPNLAGATPALVEPGPERTPFATGTVVTSGTGEQVVRFEWQDSVSGALEAGVASRRLMASLASGDVVHLADVVMEVV